MGAVKHRDVAQFHVFVAQLENTLGDELRLLAAVIQSHEGWTNRFRLTRRRKMFSELLHVRGDGRVRDLENFRNTAVIHFNLEYLRFRVALRELENVLKIGPAP